ncbi:MAG: pilus assembly protein PilP [Myxococcales bacterium]|nr:pilus assembly protein PilP [Myxococcales bacterium]
MSARGRVAAVSVAAVVWVACGEEATTTAAVPVAQPRRSVAVDAGVSATAEPYLYSYVSMGKRDPFRGTTVGGDTSTATSAGSTDGEVCDEPLCQVDLDELRLVAVVSGDANPVAMVEDRTGTGHVVRRNTKVGRQAGKVTAILKDCIVVTSFVVGPDGRAQPNRQSLCVSTEGQGTNPVLDLMNGKTRE